MMIRIWLGVAVAGLPLLLCACSKSDGDAEELSAWMAQQRRELKPSAAPVLPGATSAPSTPFDKAKIAPALVKDRDPFHGPASPSARARSERKAGRSPPLRTVLKWR